MAYDDKAALAEFISLRGAQHITVDEVLRCGRRKVEVPPPPVKLWPNIIPTIEVFELLRDRMRHPLLIGNGYRPRAFNRAVGGAKFSAHIYFRALDVDLPRDCRSAENQARFYREAVRLWEEFGERYQMGLGIYSPGGGIRVHIDTHHKPWPLFKSKRAWRKQYVKDLQASLR